jgi:HlyD family secretion protein
MKKKRIIIAGIIVVLIVAIYLIYSMRNHRDDGSMLLSGNVEITETNVGFKIPGRIIEIPIDEGVFVKEGDMLAKLDSVELFSMVEQNRALLREAWSGFLN